LLGCGHAKTHTQACGLFKKTNNLRSTNLVNVAARVRWPLLGSVGQQSLCIVEGGWCAAYPSLADGRAHKVIIPHPCKVCTWRVSKFKVASCVRACTVFGFWRTSMCEWCAFVAAKACHIALQCDAECRTVMFVSKNSRCDLLSVQLYDVM
jgi:hypothetical protein